MKKSDSTVLGPKYSIALKRDNTTDVVTIALKHIMLNLVATDTDVETNPNIKFKNGEAIPAGAVKGAVITVKSDATTTDNAKEFNSLNNLLGINIIVQLESINNKDSSRIWKVGDELTISCKTADFEFNTGTAKKTWDLA